METKRYASWKEIGRTASQCKQIKRIVNEKKATLIVSIKIWKETKNRVEYRNYMTRWLQSTLYEMMTSLEMCIDETISSTPHSTNQVYLNITKYYIN